MPYIDISDLGPIKHCNMDIEDFTVLTGRQASGKSTIAKGIFFCRTIKDDILDEILKFQNTADDYDIALSVESRIRSKFIRIFGMSSVVKPAMNLEYYFSEDTYFKISSEQLNIKFSNEINKYIFNISKAEKSKDEIKKELNILFNDEYDCVFIPAGRSLITTLTSQLNYLFASMDDDQKSMMDYCTQKFIEYVLKIKSFFSEGIAGLTRRKTLLYGKSVKIDGYSCRMEELISQVLKGKYVFADGEERIYLDDKNSGEYVKINYASSGQQETVWLFNVLFYILVNRAKTFIILEEPEAHLYPDAQKVTSEVLALMSCAGCQMFITTHSPYVLGALNNLIFAGFLEDNYDCSEKLDELTDKFCRIKKHSAYQVENGTIHSCIEETPEKLIMNEVIDGASQEINELYDRLFDITLN